MPRTVAIIQARMGSSRLPGKVLLNLGGKPMLQHVVERTERAQTVDAVIVATTTDKADVPILDFCASVEIACFRGSQHDVLDRYFQAARLQDAEVVVRITGDCPLIDPSLIDQTVQLVTGHWKLETGLFDFACNRLPPPFPRSFPIGLDVEACTFAALKRAWKEADQPFHREHVMPYLYEGTVLARSSLPPFVDNCSVSAGLSPRGFRVAQLHHHPDYGSLRWTVDTPADLALVRELLSRLERREDFSWQDVLQIWQRDPSLAEINAGVRHKTLHEVDERTGK